MLLDFVSVDRELINALFDFLCRFASLPQLIEFHGEFLPFRFNLLNPLNDQFRVRFGVPFGLSRVKVPSGR